MNDERITTMVTNDNDNAASKNAPAVSVVMITYNHAPYIEEAITSILKQNFSGSLELIIGDDCSTDITTNIVRHFHQLHPSKIKLIKSDSNVGMQANARRCIEACTGEYIAFCEGDDFWSSPLKLQKQVDFLTSDLSCGAVHSDFTHILFKNGEWRGQSDFQENVRGLTATGNIFDKLLHGNFIQTCTLLARKPLVDNYLSDSMSNNNYLVGDWPLCLYLAANSKIGYIEESLSVYRKTEGSITNNSLESDLLRTEDSRRMIDDFSQRFCRPESVLKSAIASTYLAQRRIAYFSANTIKLEEAVRWLERYPVRNSASEYGLLQSTVAKFGFAHKILAPLLRFRKMRQLEKSYKKTWK